MSGKLVRVPLTTRPMAMGTGVKCCSCVFENKLLLLHDHCPFMLKTEVLRLHFMSEENRLQHRDKYSLEALSNLCSCLGAPTSLLNLYVAAVQQFIGSYNGRIIHTGGSEQALSFTASPASQLYAERHPALSPCNPAKESPGSSSQECWPHPNKYQQDLDFLSVCFKAR